MAARSPVAETLASRTVPAADALVETLEDGRLRCYACGHRCPIPEGREGVCRVRFRENGTLKVPWGYVGALQCDPIEKKPFFHALPGSDALSFGMLGCDLHCAYCQNWFTSQSVRDPDAVGSAARHLRGPSSRSLPSRAVPRRSCRRTTSRSSLRSGPWQSSQEARRRGLRTAYVSNGNGTPQVLDYIRPWVDFYKVDLKSMDDKHYRQLGGVLQNVLDTIAGIHERGIWLEVLTLVIPGFNDSEEELTSAARLRRLGVEGHPLARDGVSPGLQDDGSGRDAGRDPHPGVRDRDGRGPALRLRGKHPGPGGGVGEHPLPQVRGRP